MSDYSLETGEYLWRLTCDCCGKQKNRVWGFISKNGDAHAIYYALLNVEEELPRVGLTLSVGPWWDGSEPSQRSWIHLDVWSGHDGTHMGIRDPKESNFYPWEKGGTPLTREQAKLSDAIQEIWSVADFIVVTDAAVSSYLNGSGVDIAITLIDPRSCNRPTACEATSLLREDRSGRKFPHGMRGSLRALLVSRGL